LATTYPRWHGDHEPGFVHELAKRLTDRFDVHAVVPHAKGAARREVLDGVTVWRYRYAPTRWETLVQDGGITTHLRRSPWKWLLVPGFFLMQWAAARRLAGKGAIVHAHWIVLPGIVARLLGRRYLVTSHGADLFALRGRHAVSLKRWVMARADEATVVSRAMVPLAAALRDGREPQVAPMGVDLATRFVPDASVARDADHLLFVGRLVEKKGVDVLLDAMPAVLARRPGARLSIVGHGPLTDVLKDRAARLGVAGAVDFVGPLPAAELPDRFRRASLFVAPFRPASSGDQEGLGLVLVEALGCGCPVVTTDIDAVSDVVDGMSGVTRVSAGNVDALAH
ncbi:hypothetical protein KCV01_g10759, partial [Aureobasidium melanogenum]